MKKWQDFDESAWQELNDDCTRWWNGNLDRPLVYAESLHPTEVYEAFRRKFPNIGWFTARFPLEVPAREVIDYYTAELESKSFFGDACPKWFPNFGPGIIAGFLGAEVHVAEDTVWFSPPRGFDLETYPFTFDENNKWFRRVMDLTRAALDAWGKSVIVGFTDLGGNFDILASFRPSEDLLMDLYDRPDVVGARLREIIPLWKKYYQTFHDVIRPTSRGTSTWCCLWSPQKTYMLQSDFSYMIGPDMFERFVIPDLAACCDFLDHGVYHLDGRGQIPHVDHLLSLDRLRCIQWVPGEGAGGPQDYPDLLKKIIDAGKLCQVYVTPEGAMKIKKEIGARNFAFRLYTDHLNDSRIAELVQDLCR